MSARAILSWVNSIRLFNSNLSSRACIHHITTIYFSAISALCVVCTVPCNRNACGGATAINWNMLVRLLLLFARISDKTCMQRSFSCQTTRKTDTYIYKYSNHPSWHLTWIHFSFDDHSKANKKSYCGNDTHTHHYRGLNWWRLCCCVFSATKPNIQVYL